MVRRWKPCCLALGPLMPAFVIVVNGRQVCSADLGDGAHGVDIAWIGPAADPLIVFHVGGVSGGDQVRWDMPQLSIGDEVIIKIVASDGTTPPSQRHPNPHADQSGGRGPVEAVSMSSAVPPMTAPG